MRATRPPTRMVRVRISDANRLKEQARLVKLQLPDYISHLLKSMKGGTK